jgi:pyruvate formate lyase activating enzyme
MKEALFWEPAAEGKVHCRLCPHQCRIAEGKTGFCGVRKNEGGRLYSLVWGRSIAANVDPIEKKPLYHFLPGSYSFSIATVGCNLRCRFCQNSDISQYPLLTGGGITGEKLLPGDVVKSALDSGCRSISYTYTEPSIYIEYVLDTARIAKEQGVLNVMISNGYISKEVVTGSLKGIIDAANIDLKGFTDDYYRRLCSARLAPVLDAIQAYHDAGVWIEITMLVIPGENDSEGELRDIARYIRSVDENIPWHISRYFPRYQYDKAPPTPVKTLDRAREIGLSEGLKFVYTGNVMGNAGENTFCPHCGKEIMTRSGLSVQQIFLIGGSCGYCHGAIPGRF